MKRSSLILYLVLGCIAVILLLASVKSTSPFFVKLDTLCGTLSRNLLQNSDFKSYYAYWEGAMNNFVITESDDENIISFTPLSEKRTWFKLKQFFKANKGDVYELSYDQRYQTPSQAKSDAFLVFSYIDDEGKDAGEKYFQLDTKGKTTDWQRKTHKINITETQKACFRLQFTGHPLCEVKNIKLIKSQ